MEFHHFHFMSELSVHKKRRQDDPYSQAPNTRVRLWSGLSIAQWLCCSLFAPIAHAWRRNLLSLGPNYHRLSIISRVFVLFSVLEIRINVPCQKGWLSPERYIADSLPSGKYDLDQFLQLPAPSLLFVEILFAAYHYLRCKTGIL